MKPGLMQTAPLLISSIIKYAENAHGRREIVSRLIDEPLWRYDFSGLALRARKAAQALKRLGVDTDGTVSTLAWNTHRHMELFYAVPGLGSILHTANPRLHDDQIVYTINHADSTVLLFDRNLLPLVERIAPRLERIRTYVVLSDADRHVPGTVGALCYENLLSAESGDLQWPSFDENTGAVLCYTSGTTGDPKGVLYSHRAIVIHAMAECLPSAFGLNAFDVVLPGSSLYHATAWGLPFAALVAGAKFVLPADKMDGASLHELIAGEGVTFTGGVPTIWTGYLNWLDQNGATPGSLKRLTIGGSAVPRVMAETFQERYGVQVLQIWGMTETCPLGVVATPTPELVARGEAQMRETIWTRQGRLQFGIEIRCVDEAGNELPRDGVSSGTLQVRGPWVVQQYFKRDESATDPDGWFDTGDVATLDADGFLRLTDRKKDVIKSGGEWISSIDLENVAVGCPGVKIAGVIGIPDPKWEERPLLVIETLHGVVLTREAVMAFMTPRVAKWWLPEDVMFSTIPLTATGKVDKKALRSWYRDLQSE